MGRRAKRGRRKNVEDSRPEAYPNSLVFDIMIRSLKCPKLLRTCRLVCKSWNESACAALRQIVTLNFDETNQSVDHFKKIIKARQFNSQRNLPQNFTKVRVRVEYFSMPSFLKILHNWDVELLITNLQILEHDRFRMSCCREQKPKKYHELHAFLLTHAESLTTLSLEWNDEPNSPQKFNFDEIRLGNLKKFEVLLGENSPSFASRLLQQILRWSTLDHLTLNFRGDAPPILRNLDLENVKAVEIYMDMSLSIDDDPLPSFRNIPLANLKILGIASPEKSKLRVVTQVISQWSGTLEDIFVAEKKIRLNHLPICANLKVISSMAGFTGQFDPKKFPLLKRVSSSAPPTPNKRPIPHFGVQCLNFACEDYQFGDDFKDALPHHIITALENYARQFPNVTDFGCDFYRLKTVTFSAEIFKTIRKCFPSLKFLKLTGELESWPEASTGGISKSESEDLARHPLADFHDLEGLQLDSQIKVTPDLIRRGLGVMPKLKYLKFYKIEGLTPEIIREYLGHLVKIEMHSCKRSEECGCHNQLSDQEKLKLEQYLPGVIHFFDLCFGHREPE